MTHPRRKSRWAPQSGPVGSVCGPIASHVPDQMSPYDTLAKNRRILMKKLYVPEWSKHNLPLSSVVTSLPRTPASLPRHLLCTFYVFVEPFGEFSSRQTLRSEKKCNKIMKRKQLPTQTEALLGDGETTQSNYENQEVGFAHTQAALSERHMCYYFSRLVNVR